MSGAGSIRLAIAVAKFVGQVKGVAATRFNKLGATEEPLYWQGEYGALSFDAKRLPHVMRSDCHTSWPTSSVRKNTMRRAR
jgi:hypothetical protein